MLDKPPGRGCIRQFETLLDGHRHAEQRATIPGGDPGIGGNGIGAGTIVGFDDDGIERGVARFDTRYGRLAFGDGSGASLGNRARGFERGHRLVGHISLPVGGKGP
jgi:hypothetical protein